MEQSDTVVLENNEEYNVVNRLVYNDLEYLLLSNVSNVKDICIRKIKKEGKNQYICRLEDNELKTVFDKFVESNKYISGGNN